ncbi:hypothetical protein [Phytobacter diazotrophicus]|uniref:hypothetical protein n=1 Tax=Phytobacter diazotrophicus TaxID=395631 RepID=UPI002FF9C234
MNSYRENVQSAAGNTLAGLYAQQQQLQSQNCSAQYSLYYAQGAQLNAYEGLTEVKQQLLASRLISEQGVECDNLATNLDASAKLVQQATATTVTNSAATAAGIQAAAKAISTLAAELGSALNIAAAACYGTDIYRKTLEANSFIRTTANHAEYITRLAMDAAAASSEVIATDLVNQSALARAALKTVQGAANAQFTALSQQVVAGQTTLATASNAEKLAEGALEDTGREMRAINSAVEDCNRALNFNLIASVTGTFDGIAVSLDPYQQPFTTWPEGAGIHLASDITIPAANPEHYVFIAKAENAGSVKLEQIEALFNTEQTKYFHAVTADDGWQVVLPVSASGSAVADIDGDLLAAGVSYVACVYVVLSLPYQKYINSFNNILSCVSLPVTLQAPLGQAKGIAFSPDKKSVLFTLPPLSEDITQQEFRVMLLHSGQPLTGGFMTSEDTDAQSGDAAIGFYFNKAIAEQVPGANYRVAHCSSTQLVAGGLERSMKAVIPDDMTDNFGALLVPGIEYLPVVLAVPSAININANAWSSTLAFGAKAETLIPLAGSREDAPVVAKAAAAAPSASGDNNEHPTES